MLPVAHSPQGLLVVQFETLIGVGEVSDHAREARDSPSVRLARDGNIVQSLGEMKDKKNSMWWDVVRTSWAVPSRPHPLAYDGSSLVA